MTQEALKLALEALENHTAIKHPQQIYYRDKAITALRKALAQEQEPVAWMWDVNNGGGYTTRDVGLYKTNIPFAKHTPLYAHPPQLEERNFCSRCGKRTKDLTHIHTCTPPKKNT